MAETKDEKQAASKAADDKKAFDCTACGGKSKSESACTQCGTMLKA